MKNSISETEMIVFLDEQIARLTQPILWYVEQQVTEIAGVERL